MQILENMTTIAQRLQATRAAIDAALTKAGRQDDAPTLVAVSKTQPASVLRAAYAAGQTVFGENYVQEALQKQAELADLELSWHFIGPIQSNKTTQIAQHFAWAHSVDRLKIAQRLNDARPDESLQLNVCIQINVSHEDSKGGIAPTGAAELAAAIAELPKLRLRGLMAIPAPGQPIAVQHQQFRQLRALLLQLNAQGHALDTLSMGMSDDFATAIAEGATMLRIGSAIFGARSPAAASTTYPASD